MTQKEIILKHLNDIRDWVFSYELQGKQNKYGWLGSQADRRARQLIGRDGDKPEFEYTGIYRNIKHIIRGRIIDRGGQYYVGIVEEEPEAKKEVKLQQGQMFITGRAY